MEKDKIKLSMISLGCSKNRIDAEIMLAALMKDGFRIVSEPSDSDIVIVNTCGFIEDAKKEAIDTILEVARLKEQKPLKLVVTGCLAQRYIDELRGELPEVDAAVTIGADGDIVSICKRVMEGECFDAKAPRELLPLGGDRYTEASPTAYIKLAEGCDNHCTYCAIPMIRGRYRSRTIEDIKDEAELLVGNGARELVLIAQDTTRYGEDLYGRPMLAELLKELGRIDGLYWMRLLYCYPDRITDELIEEIAVNNKVVKYIDIPLQHCSKPVLRRMNRFGDRESLMSLINKLRERIPNIVIRTTLMVGFPGETHEDFEELDEFVMEARFDRMGCFSYSREEGTPAEKLPDQIEEDVKASRYEVIMLHQQRISSELNQSCIGKTYEVLVEGYDFEKCQWYGRSYGFAPEVDGCIYFTSDNEPNVGEFVNVRISLADEYDLFGEEA